jgi:hypothetical protein
MPNWCTNILSICGPNAEVDGFVTACKATDEDSDWQILDSLYPVPDDLKNVTARFGINTDDDPHHDVKANNIEQYGHADWYDWSIANWGTKWADCHTQKVHEEECHPSQGFDEEDILKKVMFRFDSAWSPPIEGFDAIAMLFPKLVFDLRYEEPGMCFQGFRTWANGECQAEGDMEYMMNGDMAFETLDWEYDNLVTESEEK